MSDSRTLLPVAQVAHVTGIGERRIRRWIAAGRLPAVESPLGKMVDPDSVRHLASDSVRHMDAATSDSRTPSSDTSDTVRYVNDPALVAVIERQQQTIMEMSGRLGYFQRRIHELEETVLALQAPTPYHPAEAQNGPHSAVHVAGSASNGAERPPDASTSVAPVETPQRTADHAITARRSWWARFWRRATQSA